MDNNRQIQRTESQQIRAITKDNWQSELARLPIKVDSPPSEVLRLGTPQVSALNAGTGSKENGITVFEVLVQAIVKFYGTGWGAQQREVAEIMHGKYYWLHLAEIRQFSMKAKAGDFNRKDWFKGDNGEMEEWDGKIYGQLTAPVLLKWMERFALESTAARAGIDWDKKPLPPMTEEEKGKLVSTETVKEAIDKMCQEYGLTPDFMDREAKQEILRQEKIKQRQRDVMLRDQNKDAA
jgi:hypothetical protein